MFIGPKPAFFNDNKKGQFSILWLITLLASLLQQHMSSDLMICHAAKLKFYPTQNKLNVIISIGCYSLTFLWLVFPQFYVKNINLLFCVYGIFIITFLCNLHFILNLITEIACALNIKVFKVKNKVEESVKQTLLQNK